MGKAGAKKMGGDEAKPLIVEYIRKQNRPYNSVDITTNLKAAHGFSKPNVTKWLGELSESGAIVEKTDGKKKIYFANQAHFGEVTPEQLRQLDEAIAAEQKRLEEAQALDTKLGQEESGLSRVPTTAAALTRIAELRDTVGAQTEQLAGLQEASRSSSFSREAKDRILKDHAAYVKLFKQRKRKADDMLGTIMEGWTKSRRVLEDDIGLETGVPDFLKR